MSCLIAASHREQRDYDVTHDVTRDDVTGLAGLTISLSNSADLHPLQIKKRICSRRHSMYTSLADFTSQGFVPYLPEGLMNKRQAPPSRRCSNESDNSDIDSESNFNSSNRRKKRLSDADIDQLSYLYSNNFDPTKSPPEKEKKKTEEVLKEEEEEEEEAREESGALIKSSRSDGELYSKRNGRRFSAVN